MCVFYLFCPLCGGREHLVVAFIETFLCFPAGGTITVVDYCSMSDIMWDSHST